MPQEQSENLHQSVLLHETVRLLDPRDGEVFADATLGLGGHAEAILQAAEQVTVIGIDQDPEAIVLAAKRLEKFGGGIRIFHANFRGH
jgi:16S rRNA (cytosine1402-N4)-methyltransferase